MPLDVARRILAFARAGLPVAIVGAAPNRTPGQTPKDDAGVAGADESACEDQECAQGGA